MIIILKSFECKGPNDVRYNVDFRKVLRMISGSLYLQLLLNTVSWFWCYIKINLNFNITLILKETENPPSAPEDEGLLLTNFSLFSFYVVSFVLLKHFFIIYFLSYLIQTPSRNNEIAIFKANYKMLVCSLKCLPFSVVFWLESVGRRKEFHQLKVGFNAMCQWPCKSN